MQVNQHSVRFSTGCQGSNRRWPFRRHRYNL